MGNNEASNGSVTVRELYTLIDNRIGQVNASIIRLENKFDNLESGRLSAIERDVATVQGRMMVIPILISIAIGAFSLIIERILK